MVQVDRGEHLRSGEWLELNRTYWEGRTGEGALHPELVAAALGAGQPRILQLGSGDGLDALALAEGGAQVIGVDFSMPAVRRARAAAAERGLAGSARFVGTNLYELRHMLPEPDSFDVVLCSAGVVSWLPDLKEWARLMEWFVTPGGTVLVGRASAASAGAAGVRTWSRSSEDLASALSAVGLSVGEGTVLRAAKPA
ncbi:class I SAM-dependent methyltransferase [Rathayibacter rathayi]|uniref:Methyltransferase domain-containing protein n=1 Tax=Rathayibacter rathayi TaxID=33887 RepID=A0ABD6WCT9_RATRA|nr:methyltransferase domain-containing protein [Rathayibacter rathayi]AZZ48378.1 methyltransferase domain-containing protein [Rathayibacter rathayi]MWV74282.1 methyltransferase domain-containing protein [Rathayibacter rathayi NCPPB 2980 = VKM Ac-1601]PPF15973.1 methyltransferase domain-containing protein [Rathayibacter rathayi]PPF23917.1 methyltransferase domain-containing protein [Rathayibacter rathayi]PPF49311.1 methyltransferase domain-containing protein [Rathayibacter rathayi]